MEHLPNVNDASILAKFIYGKMHRYGLPVDTELAQDIEQVALDYYTGKAYIEETIINASRKYKYNDAFDYISYIYYELINYGKEKSARGKRRNV